MPEFANFVLEHLGAAGLILFFGFLADYFSTPEFKSEVAVWIGGKGKISFNRRKVTQVLNSFLDGFLFRVFGDRLFSLKFFLRSSAISLLFLIVAFAIQAIYYPAPWDEFV